MPVIEAGGGDEKRRGLREEDPFRDPLQLDLAVRSLKDLYHDGAADKARRLNDRTVLPDGVGFERDEYRQLAADAKIVVLALEQLAGIVSGSEQDGVEGDSERSVGGLLVEVTGERDSLARNLGVLSGELEELRTMKDRILEVLGEREKGGKSSGLVDRRGRPFEIGEDSLHRSIEDIVDPQDI